MAMNGKDDGVMLVDIRDDRIKELRFSLTEEELVDICKKQNTIQFMIVNVSDEEDLNV